MLRVAAVVFGFLSVVLVGCDSGDASPERTSPSDGVAVASATATPDPRAYLFRIDTLEKVYEVGAPGRIPLGFLNEVTVDKADARLDANNASVQPSPYALRLSMVMGAGRDSFVVTGGHHRYEWRFAKGPESDAPFVDDDLEAFWTVSLRFDDGAWVLYGDDGSGAVPLEGADVVIGLFEISATLPIEAGSPLSANDVYFRALVYGVEPQVDASFLGVGDVYPRDLTWRKVFQY